MAGKPTNLTFTEVEFYGIVNVVIYQTDYCYFFNNLLFFWTRIRVLKNAAVFFLWAVRMFFCIILTLQHTIKNLSKAM